MGDCILGWREFLIFYMMITGKLDVVARYYLFVDFLTRRGF
jgi:hypothetical protein